MNPCHGFAISLALVCTGPLAMAQPVPPPPQLATLPATSATVAPARAPSAPAQAASASGGKVRVIEDDQVRIEEVRDIRGRLQRVTVHSKVGGKSYEINVPPGGQDNAQHRGTSGQATWSLFDF